MATATLRSGPDSRRVLRVLMWGTAGIAFHLGFLGNSAMGDLGVRYHHNGLARYVSSDGVQYNGTGDATVTPTTSDANFLTYRIGVVIPIR